MNPLAWVADALKTWPEPVQTPESLNGATPQQMAEGRNRLQVISQVTNELRKLVDQELGQALQGSAMRYGMTLFRPGNGRGENYIKDDVEWWKVLVEGLRKSPRPEDLLASLVPLKVKVTGIPMLAAALGEDADELRARHVGAEPSGAPLATKPMDEAPKFLQDLEEGEIRQVT